MQLTQNLIPIPLGATAPLETTWICALVMPLMASSASTQPQHDTISDWSGSIVEVLTAKFGNRHRSVNDAFYFPTMGLY